MSRRVHFASRRAVTVLTDTAPIPVAKVRRPINVLPYLPALPAAVCVALLAVTIVVETT